MSPFGRAMSPLQNHIFGIIWKISKNAVPQEKRLYILSETLFFDSIKRQTFSTILNIQVYTCIYIYIYMYRYMGVSENSVPLNPMVLLIIIPIKWLFHWEYTPFSDIPVFRYINMGNIHQYSSHSVPMFVAVPTKLVFHHPPR